MIAVTQTLVRYSHEPLNEIGSTERAPLELLYRDEMFGEIGAQVTSV
jgi:hypothetical protein